MISSSFDLFLPISVALLVQKACYFYSGDVNRGDFDRYQEYHVLLYLGIAAFISAIAEWVVNDLYLMTATRISKQIRYDIFHCQIIKLNKMRNNLNEQPIDYAKTKEAFNMKDLDNELKIIEKNLGFYLPVSIKAKFIIFINFIMMFFFSWKLALFVIGIFVFN